MCETEDVRVYSHDIHPHFCMALHGGFGGGGRGVGVGGGGGGGARFTYSAFSDGMLIPPRGNTAIWLSFSRL